MEPLRRHVWSHLNKQQVGAYTEYFVKMELTMYGFQVFTTEVDDRGIDFVARWGAGKFIEVQVKSLRSTGYVFLQKSKFELQENLYLALGLLFEDQPPDLYLVPAQRWQAPDLIFVDREYKGLKSKPEWGLNISKKNMAALEPYRFVRSVELLIGSASTSYVALNSCQEKKAQ